MLFPQHLSINSLHTTFASSSLSYVGLKSGYSRSITVFGILSLLSPSTSTSSLSARSLSDLTNAWLDLDGMVHTTRTSSSAPRSNKEAVASMNLRLNSSIFPEQILKKITSMCQLVFVESLPISSMRTTSSGTTELKIGSATASKSLTKTPYCPTLWPVFAPVRASLFLSPSPRLTMSNPTLLW